MELQFKRAFDTVVQTTPYLLFRAAVYGVLCGAALLGLALLGVIGAVFGAAAFWMLLIVVVGLAALLGGHRILGEYLLYRVRAGHAAVLGELLSTGALTLGVSQTGWRHSTVLQRFPDMKDMTRLSALIRATLANVTHKLIPAHTLLPAPAAPEGGRMAQGIVAASRAHALDALLAYVFSRQSSDIWGEARRGVTLFTQDGQARLRALVTVTLLGWAFVVAVALVFMLPLGIVAFYAGSASLKFILFLLAVFFGLTIKWIFYDPFALALVAAPFFEDCKKQALDPEWGAKLDEASEAFRELRRLAEEGSDNR